MSNDIKLFTSFLICRWFDAESACSSHVIRTSVQSIFFEQDFEIDILKLLIIS